MRPPLSVSITLPSSVTMPRDGASEGRVVGRVAGEDAGRVGSFASIGGCVGRPLGRSSRDGFVDEGAPSRAPSRPPSRPPLGARLGGATSGGFVTVGFVAGRLGGIRASSCEVRGRVVGCSRGASDGLASRCRAGVVGGGDDGTDGVIVGWGRASVGFRRSRGCEGGCAVGLVGAVSRAAGVFDGGVRVCGVRGGGATSREDGAVGVARGTLGVRGALGAAPCGTVGFAGALPAPLLGGAARALDVRALDASSTALTTAVSRGAFPSGAAVWTNGTRLANARMRGPFEAGPLSNSMEGSVSLKWPEGIALGRKQRIGRDGSQGGVPWRADSLPRDGRSEMHALFGAGRPEVAIPGGRRRDTLAAPEKLVIVCG